MGVHRVRYELVVSDGLPFATRHDLAQSLSRAIRKLRQEQGAAQRRRTHLGLLGLLGLLGHIRGRHAAPAAAAAGGAACARAVDDHDCAKAASRLAGASPIGPQRLANCLERSGHAIQRR
jgi:chromosome segregation ATPase